MEHISRLLLVSALVLLSLVRNVLNYKRNGCLLWMSGMNTRPLADKKGQVEVFCFRYFCNSITNNNPVSLSLYSSLSLLQIRKVSNHSSSFYVKCSVFFFNRPRITGLMETETTNEFDDEQPRCDIRQVFYQPFILFSLSLDCFT